MYEGHKPTPCMRALTWAVCASALQCHSQFSEELSRLRVLVDSQQAVVQQGQQQQQRPEETEVSGELWALCILELAAALFCP